LFEDIPSFAKIVEQPEIAKNSYSLSIPLYVDRALASTETYENADSLFQSWLNSSEAMHGQINKLNALLQDTVQIIRQ
jgi:type I restriction-modification system DNA methylase subunit